MALQVASPSWMRLSAHAWPPGLGRRPGVVHAVLRPRQGEARVEDAAGVQRGRRVVDHRERRDGGEVRRARGGDEELADAAVGDAHHADPAVRDPRLAGHGLDDVVAVQRLVALEVVERAARAARPAHVDVDDREAREVADRRDRALTTGRVRVPVARVLDERRVRPRSAREVDVDGELRPVARGQVAVAVGRQLLVVDARGRRGRAARQDGDRLRPRAALGLDAVAAARRHLPEHGAAQPAGAPAGDPVAAPVEQREGGAPLGSGDQDLVRAAAHVEPSGPRMSDRPREDGEDGHQQHGVEAGPGASHARHSLMPEGRPSPVPRPCWPGSPRRRAPAVTSEAPHGCLRRHARSATAATLRTRPSPSHRTQRAWLASRSSTACRPMAAASAGASAA